jgi:Fic family protein
MSLLLQLLSLKKSILDKKSELDSFQPIDPTLIKNLGEWMKLELTYSSNALEGNTLTRQETKLVVEDGISIGGKNINEIYEAKNHDNALTFIQELSKQKKVNELTEQDLLSIHSYILKSIDDQNAGKYRAVPVRISGSMMIPPNHLKVSELMSNLFQTISQSNTSPESIIDLAIEAHLQLVSIHPFTDGNGRTARLLFNLILLQSGYPLVFIQKEERKTYLQSLEQAQTGGSKEEYQKLMYTSIQRSLDLYLDLMKNNDQKTEQNDTQLLKIGELAKEANEEVANVRYWTQLGILKIFNTTKSNYALYQKNQIQRIQQIRYLQKEKRLSLEEIKELLK